MLENRKEMNASLVYIVMLLLVMAVFFFTLAHTRERYLDDPGMVSVMPVVFADGSSQMLPISGEPPMAWVPGPGSMNMGNIPPWMLPQVPGMGMGGMGMGSALMAPGM